MRTRLLASLTAGVLAASLLTLGGAESASASGCVVATGLPSRVSVHSRHTTVRIAIADPGSCMVYADYSVLTSNATDIADARFTSGVSLMQFDFTHGPGHYTAYGTGGVAVDGSPLITGHSNTMAVKYSPDFSLHGERRGGTIRFRLTAKHWAFGANGYVRWKGAKVHLQRKVGSSWKTYRTARANRKGLVRFTYSGSAKRWRAKVDDGSTVWGGVTHSFRL